ncbi:hypothetical protein [Sphingomonas sp. LHG3406-1]|uniref:hypothetical protein n=1 Tax=Sphingomonas sp. LHG3406-1 TaxID=2804617 RepID=UPI0026063DE9|nr:hypothetical protein [Sphingomonas sp. LHG3406-1]
MLTLVGFIALAVAPLGMPGMFGVERRPGGAEELLPAGLPADVAGSERPQLSQGNSLS